MSQRHSSVSPGRVSPRIATSPQAHRSPCQVSFALPELATELSLIDDPSKSTQSTSSSASDNVRVICRVRGFNERERSLQEMNDMQRSFAMGAVILRSVVDMTETETIFLDHNNDFAEKERFHFDHNLWSIPLIEQTPSGGQYVAQQDVYNVIGIPSLEHVWNGYNVCVFAYGQTGSGKTYTMMGDANSPGLVPHMCGGMFEKVSECLTDKSTTRRGSTGVDKDGTETTYTVTAQFVEIYNETIKDLLWDMEFGESMSIHSTCSSGMYTPKEWDPNNLKVRMLPQQGPTVIGLTTFTVTTTEELSQLIRVANQKKSVASTKMNEQSSRSHCLFIVTLTQSKRVRAKEKFEKDLVMHRVSRLSLVDLAGSERLKKSGSEGLRLREAAAINLSLTTLRSVIDALVEGKAVIPYRESQLTWLLSESLGGNSRTFMVACVSPHSDNAEETLNTMRYALRAQGIVCHARVNESDEAKRLQELRQQMEELQQQLLEGVNPGEAAALKHDITVLSKCVSSLEEETARSKVAAQSLEKSITRMRFRRAVELVIQQIRLQKEERATAHAAEAEKELLSITSEQNQEVSLKSDRVIELEKERVALDLELQHALAHYKERKSIFELWESRVHDNEATKEELEAAEKSNAAILSSRRQESMTTIMKMESHNEALRSTLERQLGDASIKNSQERRQLKQKSEKDVADVKRGCEDWTASLVAENEKLLKGTKSLSRHVAEESLKNDTVSSRLTEAVTFYQLELRSEQERHAQGVISLNRHWKAKITMDGAEWREKTRRLVEQAQADLNAAVATMKGTVEANEISGKRNIEVAQAKGEEAVALARQRAKEKYDRTRQGYEDMAVQVENERNELKWMVNYAARHVHAVDMFYEKIVQQVECCLPADPTKATAPPGRMEYLAMLQSLSGKYPKKFDLGGVPVVRLASASPAPSRGIPLGRRKSSHYLKRRASTTASGKIQRVGSNVRPQSPRPTRIASTVAGATATTALPSRSETTSTIRCGEGKSKPRAVRPGAI